MSFCPDNPNGDVAPQFGSIDVMDIVVVISFILEQAEPTFEQFCAADINSDGALNVMDIVAIVEIILG